MERRSRVLAFLRSRALLLQIAVAVVLALFFVVAAIAGNHGKIGGRASALATIPRMAALHVNYGLKYRPSGLYLQWGRAPSGWKLDGNGIPVVFYGSSLGLRYNPVTTAQYGLWRWGRWILFRRRSELAAARKQADWLVDHQDAATGKWLYSFPLTTYGLKAHWASALAQGQAISLLTRMWRQTHDRVYLTAAEKALKPLERPVRQGGVVALLDGHPWYEEAPSQRPSFILNGFMLTLLGLDDLHATVPTTPAGREAARLYRTGIRSLAYGLPQFDAGHGGQYYDLRPKRWPGFPREYASLGYMGADVQLLQALNSISPNRVLRHFLGRWSAGTIPTPPVPIGTNLLPNPGFEDRLTGWRPVGGASLTVTTLQPRLGKTAAQVKGIGRVPRRYGIGASYRRLQPKGASYVVSVWIRGDPTTYGRLVRLVLTGRGPGSVSDRIARSTFRIGRKWEHVAASGAIQHEGETRLNVGVQAEAGIGLGDKFYVDGVVLKRVRSSRAARGRQ